MFNAQFTTYFRHKYYIESEFVLWITFEMFKYLSKQILLDFIKNNYVNILGIKHFLVSMLPN